MPPIASSLVDTNDVAKVVDWIGSMPSAPMLDAGPDGGADPNAEAGTDVDAGTDAATLGD